MYSNLFKKLKKHVLSKLVQVTENNLKKNKLLSFANRKNSDLKILLL